MVLATRSRLLCFLTGAAVLGAAACGSDKEPKAAGGGLPTGPLNTSPGLSSGFTSTTPNTTKTNAQTSSSGQASSTGPNSKPSTTFPDGVIPPGPLEGGPATRCGELPFDPTWFRARIARLSGAVDAMIGGTPKRINERFTDQGRAMARSWIIAQYQALGYQVQEDPYEEGINIIATKPGASPTFYVLSSHYDTVPNSPGADDDATGVITNLAIAAALAPCQTDVSLKFIAFDQEERRMTGAHHFARSMANANQADQILGNIQVEMTGWDSNSDGAFNIVHCDKPDSMFLANAIDDAVKVNNLPLYSVSGCTERSDHQAFWAIDRPAIAVSELFFADVPDKTPCYHKTCDTYDKVNFEYMDQLARALTHTTLKLSGAR